jgi:hypothetical protein
MFFFFFFRLNTLYTPVLYDLYFLSPQFHFLSNLVLVVYEKTEMIHPSDFPSKTNVHPCHWTGVGVHAQHVSVHTSAILRAYENPHNHIQLFKKEGNLKTEQVVFLLPLFPKCLKTLNPNPNQLRPDKSPQIKLRN